MWRKRLGLVDPFGNPNGLAFLCFFLDLQHNSSITCRLQSAFISVGLGAGTGDWGLGPPFLYLSQTPIPCDKFVWLGSTACLAFLWISFRFVSISKYGDSFSFYKGETCACARDGMGWDGSTSMPRYVSRLREYSNGMEEEDPEEVGKRETTAFVAHLKCKLSSLWWAFIIPIPIASPHSRKWHHHHHHYDHRRTAQPPSLCNCWPNCCWQIITLAKVINILACLHVPRSSSLSSLLLCWSGLRRTTSRARAGGRGTPSQS